MDESGWDGSPGDGQSCSWAAPQWLQKGQIKIALVRWKRLWDKSRPHYTLENSHRKKCSPPLAQPQLKKTIYLLTIHIMYFIYLNSWKCLLIYLYFTDYKTIITNSKLVVSSQIIKSQWEKFVASNCSNQCWKWHENLFGSHYSLIVLESCKRIIIAFLLLVGLLKKS